MHFSFLIWFLITLCTGRVAAQSAAFRSSLALRQAGAPTTNCNATCTNYQELQDKCIAPHCGCGVPFLQAQGDCFLCQTSTPADAANVQVLLDLEISECHRDNIQVEFQLDLHPAAAAIVQQVNRDNISLRRIQSAFLALQVSGGNIGLTMVLVFAVFSHRVNRDATFLNFCITWILSSVAYSLQLYRGIQYNSVFAKLVTDPTMCLLQAALIQGAQVLTACSTLALVTQFWLKLRAAVHRDSSRKVKQTLWTTSALLMMPYILFIAFAVSSVIIGKNTIDIDGIPVMAATPDSFYCTMDHDQPFLKAAYGVTLGLLIVAVVFDVFIIEVLYRDWRAFRRVQKVEVVPLSVLLRVIAFSICRVVVAVAYGAVLNAVPEFRGDGGTSFKGVAIFFNIPIWTEMLQAAIPLTAFIILGITKDMVDFFMFWRRFQPNGAVQSNSIIPELDVSRQ